jgi:hypothetical protein
MFQWFGSDVNCCGLCFLLYGKAYWLGVWFVLLGDDDGFEGDGIG